LQETLALFGREGWKFNELVEIISCHAFKDIHLHWVRDGNDDELRYAYGHCDLYLSASLAEGFGLPVIEALAHKLPVLISDISVYREIVGKTAAYFDPASETALAEELLALMTNPERLERLRLNAINFKWQSWAESGASVFRRLHDLASINMQPEISVPADANRISRSRSHPVVQSNADMPL
jgi:glycosyltransferase involved in cell wall biosynthesis